MADEKPSSVDYCRSQQTAEEVASALIDVILTNGTAELYQRYLKKKAFLFAETTVANHVMGQLEMCFVNHDSGEAQVLGESWGLEEEYVPKGIDSWAGMRLVQRRKTEDDGSQRGHRSRPHLRSRTGHVGHTPKQKKDLNAQRPERQIPMTGIGNPVDEEEDRLRELKAQDKQRMIDKESKARIAEKDGERQRAEMQELHEKMDQNPHTFDSEGGIIWIAPPDMKRLPPVQEILGYHLKKDPRAKESTNQTASANPPTPKSVDRPASKAGKKGKHAKARGSKMDDEFTDGFSKLQHGQPPVIETMACEPGVTVESQGRKKAGPIHDPEFKRNMSRKEYVELAERELGPGADGGGVSSGGDLTKAAGDGGSAAGDLGGGGADGVAAARANSRGLPPVASAADVKDSQGSLFRSTDEPMTEAAAPKPSFKSKFEALGYQRHPRHHKAELGGHGFGMSQPPVGATMGHGLHHNSEAKDTFFFPDPNPVSPVLRSASEGFLRKDRSRISGSGGGSTESLPRSRLNSSQSRSRPGSRAGGGLEAFGPLEDHGVIKGEKKSAAYRSVLAAMGANNTQPLQY